MQPEYVSPSYLATARAAARWIFSRQSKRHWPSEPVESLEDQLDLYHGIAGTILFFLELAQANGERNHYEAARSGADYIANHLEQVTDCGLYCGLAGMAFSLDRIITTGEDSFLRGSLNRAIDRLRATTIQHHPGVSWNEQSDLISGTAGIGLALIQLGARTGRNELLELAKGAGDRLLSVAQESAKGIHWTRSAAGSKEYPNFSHGTAGIGYFLAELYEATNDGRYRLSALAAGHYLQSIVSKVESCEHLIFHDNANGRNLFYLGWCHGPAGTGRFFYRLYQLTNDPGWLTLVRNQATTLMASGIPERQTPGYWNNVSQCCGAAGVGEFFLGLFRATRDRSYLAFAERVAGYLIARAETETNGVKWTQAERRIEPERLVAQSGLMQGAAGVGLFLVHVDQACRGQSSFVRLPDQPLWEKPTAAE
jgi:lantibiotic modifying enzyme